MQRKPWMGSNFSWIDSSNACGLSVLPVLTAGAPTCKMKYDNNDRSKCENHKSKRMDVKLFNYLIDYVL
jgi:hypothetical protein